MKKYLTLAASSLILITPLFVRAQEAVGYDFLRTLVGARPSAMSGAFIAIPGDIHNIFYNPAGLTHIAKRQGTISYINHLLDLQSGFLGYAQPLSKSSVGFALHFFDFGQFEGKDDQNNDIEDFGASSFALSASYAREIMPNLSVGASGKFIRFQISDFNSTALALDLGVIFSIPDRELNLGFGVFNLGSATSAFIDTKDKLPLNFQFGLSKKLEHLPVLLSGSIVKFRDDGLDFRLGGEISVTEQLFARVGYNSVGQDQKVDTGKDSLAGVAFGLGFKINTFDVDYSFSSFGEVGSLNRISLVGRF